MHCLVCWGGGGGWASIGGEIFVDREGLGIEVEGGIKDEDNVDCFQTCFYAIGELN